MKLDEHYANLEQKRQVFENSIGSEIEVLKVSLSQNQEATKPLILPSMADEDNTQIDGEIQNLVNKLNERVAKFDQKRKVLEHAKGSEIKALKKDRDEAWKLKSSLLNESGDTRQEIANVNNWLDQKTLLSGEDQDYNFTVLIVDDDLTVRDTNRRLMMSVETQQQLTMEFQEAKNGKEAVYLHLAGASYDLILMENHMPIMTGIQVYVFLPASTY
ncbi:hypothetical protein NC651_009320 [Populus alba x Populus x berolinensis]|nr:hypothetical protein NC651_009320 [Populus alba x Populus x berolinensis]